VLERYLHEAMYANIVHFEESTILDRRNVMNSGVNGPLKTHWYIGWKTSSLHPYAYLLQNRSADIFEVQGFFWESYFSHRANSS
jgi:hypothetical protein